MAKKTPESQQNAEKSTFDLLAQSGLELPPGIRRNGGSTINPPEIASVKATDSAKIASSFSSLNS